MNDTDEQEELLSPRIRALIGTELPDFLSLPVSLCDIRRYCEATGDLHPLYTDEEYAKRTVYGGITAPPAFYQVPFLLLWHGAFGPVPQGIDLPYMADIKSKVGLERGASASQSMAFFEPVRVGDTLTYKRKIADIVQKQLKNGPALLVSLDITVTNQNGDLVCQAVEQHFFWP